MNKLITYKKPELVILEENTKIRDFSESEFNTNCSNLVYKLLNLLGVNDGKQEHHIELIKFINQSAGKYTFQEIDKAFRMYINHEFNLDVYQQLNAVVFGNVMKCYEDYKKVQLKNYRTNLQIPMEVEKTEEEKEKIVINGLIIAFNFYKKNDYIENGYTYLYSWLFKKDLMPKDSESIKRVKRIAKNRFKKLSKLPKISKSDINKYVKEIQGLKTNSFISMCREISLEIFFSKCETKDKMINFLSTQDKII